MTKGQKIAIGCGGVGCLGLIVAVVVCVGLYFYYSQLPTRNSNTPRSTSANTNRSSNSSRNSNSGSSTAATSMSDDDKHKLFQAASMTQDADLVTRVGKKIGLENDDNTPGDNYAEFVKDHVIWAFKNGDFINSVNTPEKARAYVDAHIDE